MRENKINILTLNETKLDSKTEEEQVSIPGYTVLRCDRNSHGSGVAIYLQDTLNFEHRIDLKTDNLEMICIERNLNVVSLSFFWLGIDHQIMRLKH